MIVVAWILQVVLAVVFLAAGGVKLVRPKAAIVAVGPRMAWAEDYSDNALKGIGALEVVGAVGLILPALTGVAPILTPIAALGLAAVMAAATVVHVRRKESVASSLGLAVLSLALAVIGFLTYA